MKTKYLSILGSLFLIAVLVLQVAGCGSNSVSTSANTGGIVAKLQWSDSGSVSEAKASNPHVLAAPTGVATVRIIVSGSGMTAVQQDFAAAAGSGSVNGIAAGSGRTVTAEGLDSGGLVKYQGSVGNVTVQAGQTTNVGTIVLQSVSTSPSVSLPKTGQVASWYPNDDGALQTGVAWPTPRFTDNGDGTVTDGLTGLVWLQDINCFGPQTWSAALVSSNTLANGQCGLNDGSTAGQWRLPNRNELWSLIDFLDFGPAMLNSGLFYYGTNGAPPTLLFWSSSTVAGMPSQAWYININDGSVYGYGYGSKSSISDVWPVRSGPSSGAVQLPATGQTTCYDTSGNVVACSATGQDADKAKGVAWPNSRFVVSGNCVSDNLTGLMWSKDGNLSAGPQTWTPALDFVASLNSGSGLCGFKDWRLPNVRELESLINAGQANTATWLNTQGFVNVQSGSYWSSTTYSTYAGGGYSYAWYVDMLGGNVLFNGKTYLYYVLPVRSAQ